MQAEERVSRLLDSGNAPQSLHLAPAGGNPTAVADELMAAIVASVSAEHRDDAIASTYSLLERVERCAAVAPDDIKPISRHQNLWELRVDDQATGVHVRIYIAEVDELPNTIVALHAHAKLVRGSRRSINKRQNEAIALAMLRFEAGRKVLWNAPRS